MKRLAVILALLGCLCAHAQTANVTYNVTDFLLTPQNVATVTLTPFGPGVFGTQLLAAQARTLPVVGSGVTFTNVVMGYAYRVAFRNFNYTTNSFWTNCFPATLSGNINGANWVFYSLVFQGGTNLSGFIPTPRGMTIYVDQVNGNDATAQLGNESRPSLTISNAVNLATNGCLVWVRPGIYAEHKLLKPGLNYHGDPGATIQYIQTGTNEDGHGIFDDYAGASTNYIEWAGTLEYDGLTNVTTMSNYWVAFPENNPNNANIQPNNSGVGTSFLVSPIVVTNPASRLNVRVGVLRSGNMMSACAACGAVLLNGNNCSLWVGLIENPFLNFPGYEITDYDGFGDSWNFSPTATFGVYWAFGNAYVHCDDNEGNANAIWCDEPPPHATSENDFYYDGDLINSSLYTTASTYNEVGWFNIKRAKSALAAGSGANELEFFGSGKWYVNVQKADTTANTTSVLFINTSPGSSNALVWVTAEKFTASSGAAWFKVVCGTLWASISHLEDAGGAVPSIFSGNAEAHIDGMTARMGAANMISRTTTTGTAVEFKNFTLVDTNGAIVSLGTNAISFNNVNMVTPSTSPVIANTTPTSFAINWNGGSSTNGGVREWTNTVTVFGYLETNNVFYSH